MVGRAGRARSVSALRRGTLTAVLLVVAALTTATVSSADPADPPSDHDVQVARGAVASAAAEVASIEVELASDSASVDQAWTAVATAAEAYSQAQTDQASATAAATVAAQREAAGKADLEAARADLGVLALEAYRSGGSMDTLSVLVASDGYDDLVARTAAMEQLGDRAQRAVQRFQAAELVARTLGQRARTAAQEADDATAAAQTALKDAQDLQATAQQRVEEVSQRRDAMLQQLTVLRNTSIEVERARQDAKDAERAARAEAAAAAARGVTPVGTTPGGGSGSTTPPATTPPPAVTPPAVTPPPVVTPPVTRPPVVTPPVTEPPVTPPPVTPPAVTPPAVTPPPAPTPDPYGLGTGSQRGSAGQGQAAVDWAVQQVGKAYGLGMVGPDAFDCSGLTSKAWAAAGVSINRTSRDQYRQVRKITYDSLRPGDLIFYGTDGSDPGSIYHVAMFVGGGQMVEAPRPGVNVRVTAVRWASTMPFAGRP
ncbi:MAG TPA: C40 family peptidase [Actinotalea sp.]